MPAYKSIEAQESFQAHMADIARLRRQVCAGLVWDVIPKAEAKALTKKRLVKDALRNYREQSGALKESDPFLSQYSDKFINAKFILGKWADIKDELAQEGRFIAYNHKGVWGSRSQAQLEQTFASHRLGVQKSAERYTYRAELANKKHDLEVPVLTIQLLLPAAKSKD